VLVDVDAVSQLTNLTTFTWSSSVNGVTISPNITRLVNLRYLTLSLSYAPSFPSLSGMYNLQEVRISTISAANIRTLPSDMFQGLGNLTTLTISTGSRLTEVPSLTDLGKLTTLDLTSNNLTTLPDTFSSNPLLYRLTVTSNLNLKKLPDSLASCAALAEVIADQTGLINDDSWFDMTATQVYVVSCYNCKMNYVPTSLCKLSRLTSVRLYLTFNPIQTFPSCFSDNTGLKYLYMSQTNFTTFPAVIAQLTNLIDFQSQYNTRSMTGPLPDFSAMTQLYSFQFDQNYLTAEFPYSMLSLPALQILTFYANSLSGTFSDNAFASSPLRQLTISGDGCTMNGPFPSSWGNSIRQVLRARGCKFTSLPETFGKLTSQTNLDMGQNALTSMPSTEAWANMTNIAYIYLDGNTGLTGQIPPSWTSSKVYALQAQDCALTGGIPAINSTVLTEFRVSNNALDGTLGAFIKAPALERFRVDRNLLTGSISNGLSAVGTGALNIEIFDVSYNRLTGPVSVPLSGLNRLEELRINNNGFTGGLPNMVGYGYLDYFFAHNNNLDLCVFSPGVNTLSLTPVTGCDLRENLFPNACECPAFYTSRCSVNVTCPSPDYVAPPSAPVGPAPTPIKAPEAAPTSVPSAAPTVVAPNSSPVAPQEPSEQVPTDQPPTGNASGLSAHNFFLLASLVFAIASCL
jgi:Leucine-rich repeat (LRR) protein